MDPKSQEAPGAPIPGPWPFGSGDMADRIRAFDWSSTPLGPISHWPDGLRFAIDMMLGCAFPATLQWGPELFLFYNDAYIPLIGTHHPEALGKPILEAFPEITETYRPLAERVRRGDRMVLNDQVFRYTRQETPEDLWFDLSYSPVYAADGTVAGIFAIGLETTAKLAAEQARLSADTRLRRVLETDAVGVIFFDYTGTVVGANDVFLRMMGYTRDDIASHTLTWKTMTPPEYVAASEAQMQKLVDTGRIGPYEKEYILKDESRRWMLFAGRDLGDGTVAEYAIDITDRKQAEEQTRAMAERFRALTEASSDVIYRMSPDWKEMRNLQGRDFLANTEIADGNWFDKYIHPDDKELVQRAIQEALRTESTFELQHRVLQTDGSIGWTFSRAIPVRDENGKITEWFGAASDVTARKRTEEALLRNEKLATLGRLAASISHEINNPLEATTNLIYLAQITDGMPTEASRLLELAEAELQRVAHIARQSLGFYREASVALDTSVPDLLEASIDLLRGKIVTKNARINRQWEGDVRIKAVPGELRQVFSNLLANSLDALESGGEITIRASHRSVNDKPHVRITFADSGCGIEPGKRDSIFDPFFSTKGNLGTGLGLWVTRQIVDKHRGSIRMRSRNTPPMTGTAFSVTFPA